MCLFISDGIVYPRAESLKMEVANDRHRKESALGAKVEPALDNARAKVGVELAREQDNPINVSNL